MEKKVWQKAKLSSINVSNTSESVVRINPLDPVWLIKICQFFCDLPFADPIPKTYTTAAEVMGLGFSL